jgi:hypothetical protein
MQLRMLVALLFLWSSVSFAQPLGLLGSWSPYSKNYLEFGNLEISPDKLTWARCRNVPYSVIGSEGAARYIELDPKSSCSLRNRPAAVLVVLVEGDKLEVSICRSKDELKKERENRFCSWGVLYRHNKPLQPIARENARSG